jgi:alpha-galactosidase
MLTRREFQAITAGALASRAFGITVDAGGRSFTLDNGHIVARLRVLAKGGLELSFLGLKGGRNLAAVPAKWGTNIYRKAGGHVSFGIPDNGEFTFVRHEIVDAELRLYFNELRRGLSYVLHTRVLDGVPVVENWVEIVNTGESAIGIERFDPLLVTLAAPGSQACTLHYVQGCQDYGPGREVGTNLQPFGPFRVRQLSIRAGDNHTLLNTAPFYANARRSTSSSENLNWFAVELGPERDGIFGGLQWSGEWAIAFARTADQLVIHGGVHYATKNLAPGEKLTSPRAFTGVYRGDVDMGVHALHDYLRAHVIAARPDDNFPWVCYNTWYAWDISLDEAKLRREADLAAELGIECFYVDAGWYRGSPAKGNFSAGLGDWVANEKFPSGLPAFADHVRGLGMKFGLWVEPERVDGALIGKAEISPAWIAGRDGARLLRPDGSAQLCFGNPDVVAGNKRTLERVVREYKVDWLKWDHNFYLPCNDPGHGHQAGDGGMAHIMGVYQVLEHLRAFPQLVIENCAGGGNRIDFGMTRYTHTNWVSDNTDPSYRVRYQNIGCSYPYPAQYQNSWYVRSREEPVDANTAPAYLDYLFRSRMIGAFGISDRMADWPPNVREAARRAIGDVKRMRPILRDGDVYHLLGQPLLLAPPLTPPMQWEAIEYLHTPSNKGVVLCFRANASEESMTIPVRGLNPSRTYRLTSASTGRTDQRSGRDWAAAGISVRLPERNRSETLWIES